jgi:hypothetical protein
MICQPGEMKPPKQLPADLRDWIKARTFEIGAEMGLRPDSPQVWQGRLCAKGQPRRCPDIQTR